MSFSSNVSPQGQSLSRSALATPSPSGLSSTSPAGNPHQPPPFSGANRGLGRTSAPRFSPASSSPRKTKVDLNKGLTNSQTGLNASGGRRKKPKPLYNWERSPDKQRPTGRHMRASVTTEEGDYFIPSVCPGFYEKHGVQHTTPNFIDFQIVLSEECYEELLKRRRRKNAESLHVNRFGSGEQNRFDGGGFLGSSSPYIDPKRVEESLYRLKGDRKMRF